MPPAAPSCPRCGYDQSGIVVTWETSDPAVCPLEGVCSECGLTFAWRDLLNPEFARLARLFEHARRSLPAALAVTTFRAPRPRAFWTWVRIESPIHWSRLGVSVALGSITVYAAAVGLLFIACEISGWLGVPAMPWEKYWSSTDQLLANLAWPFELQETFTATARFPSGAQGWQPIVPALGAVGLLAACIMPLTFLLLPLTLRRARVRRAHLARIWAYSLIGLPLALYFPLLASMVLDSLQTGLALNWPNRLERLIARFMRHRWELLLTLVLAWLFSWWAMAARHYLRLPRAWAIAGAMLALATLLSVGLIAIFPGGAVWLTMGD